MRRPREEKKDESSGKNVENMWKVSEILGKKG